MADEPQKKKREGEVTLPKKKKKRMKDSGEESLTMNPARCTVTTKCLASEVAEDMETLSERIAALEKEYRKEQKKNRNEIKQLRKEIKKIKEENEKKEECQRFTFILKDLSVYKSIVEKIEKNTLLDHHEKRVVKLHLNEKNGIKNDKRTGVWAYFDVKNGVGHSMLTETSVEECLNLFLKYPDMATYFDVECTYEETIDFLKSCEGCVEAVKELVETEGTEREQLLLVLLGKKKTQADINSKRNGRRKKSTKQKNKMQPNKMQPNKKQPNKKQPNKKQPNRKQCH